MSTASEIQSYFNKSFPHAKFTVVSARNGKAHLTLEPSPQNNRPGGNISGPTLMALTDAALYTAIASQIGIQSTASTTNININFLKKVPGDQKIHVKASLLKEGNRLITGEVHIHGEDEGQTLAHAVGTFAVVRK